VEEAKKSLEGTIHRPEGYSGTPYAWKKMCERPDLDLIYIATPWEWHNEIFNRAKKNNLICSIVFFHFIQYIFTIYRN
jgi:hypothetical protein